MFYISIFVLGAVVGSFLNVLVLRLGTGKSVVSGRSMCFSCGHPLSPRELVPILSYLAQRGRCLHCGARISWQYPLVELVSALGFATLASQTNDTILLPLLLLIFSLALAICVYDLRHKIIPDQLVYTLIACCAVWFLANRGLGAGLLELLAGPIAASFFGLLWLVSSGRWMGFGDAKVALAMGLFLGSRGVLEAVVLAFWIGAIVGIALLLLTRRSITMKTEIPFAPFLLGAMFLEFLMPTYMHVL